MSFDQQKYIDEYKKSNYDRVTVFVPKGKKQVIVKCAESKGCSTSQLVVEALENQYKLGLSKD